MSVIKASHIQHSSSVNPNIKLSANGSVYVGANTVFSANGSIVSDLSITGNVTSYHISPTIHNTYDLGTSSVRWRNIYTQDLHLNNGIGDWTIVEGEDDLFLYNNKRNKVYKFNLIEVDANTATPKGV